MSNGLRTMVIGGVAALVSVALAAQAKVEPTNTAPNPFQTVEGWAKMPEGRTWGSTSAVDIDKDGRSIWVAERCAANNCWDAAKGVASPLDVVLKFDPSGKLVRSFGAGMFVFPHGIHVDRDGNVWVTDGQDNYPRRPRGARPNCEDSIARAAQPAQASQPSRRCGDLQHRPVVSRTSSDELPR